MANLNLQGLIDEVLGMAKLQQRENIEGSKDAAYNKRKATELKVLDDAIAAGKTHEFELERQKLINTGGLNVQGAKSAGDLAVKEVENTGSLARQRLTSGATVEAANIGLTGDKYKADRMVEAYQGKTNDPDKVLNEWIKQGLVTDTNQILEMRRKLRSQNGATDPTPEMDREFLTPDKPATPKPALVTDPLPTLDPQYAPTVKVKQPTKQTAFQLPFDVGPQPERENTLFTQNPVAKAFNAQNKQVNSVLDKRKRKELEIGR